jgi:hypothetical protein
MSAFGWFLALLPLLGVLGLLLAALVLLVGTVREMAGPR